MVGTLLVLVEEQCTHTVEEPLVVVLAFVGMVPHDCNKDKEVNALLYIHDWKLLFHVEHDHTVVGYLLVVDTLMSSLKWLSSFLPL